MTYSLIGCDVETGELGVAVQSRAFRTGAVCAWARAGVGAIAMQSFTDERYGMRGLELGFLPGGATARLTWPPTTPATPTCGTATGSSTADAPPAAATHLGLMRYLAARKRQQIGRQARRQAFAAYLAQQQRLYRPSLAAEQLAVGGTRDGNAASPANATPNSEP
jgi:hypothetical protein